MTETKQTDETETKQAPKRGLTGWLQRKIIPVEEVSRNAQLTRNMFSAIIGDDRNHRQETFEESVKRQSLTVPDLLGAYKRQKIIALILLGMMCIAFAYVIILLLNASAFTDFFIAAMAIGPIMVLGAASLRAAFRAWQIRNQRLGGFNKFIESPSQWWPTSINASHFENVKAAPATKQAASRKAVAKQKAARPKPKARKSSTA